MLDFNDFQPMGDSSNQNQPENPPESNQLNMDMNQMNEMFSNINNPQMNEEEQKRIADRQKEADERKAKINKKIEEEEKARNEIRKKASEYLVEFEAKRQENIAKRRKELEEKELNPKQENSNGTADSWSKVSGNIDLKDSEYKGSKDVQRMREAMMNRTNDSNSEPLQKFFG